MPTLNREYRRLLENTVAQARAIAEEGARKVLSDVYAVHHHEPWPHMTADERELRNQLRAHGRQLGDRRDDRRDTQEIDHLVQACAYEHWHRMLFARFLAENDLLLDSDHGMAMTLDEVRELAREQNRDWLEVAAELAQKMLLAVFRAGDPVLRVSLPPETRQQLEEKLAVLPAEVFRADDSLGWVYQFWQRDEKDAVNKSEVEIGADQIAPVTQLFTEEYMVLFLLHNTLGAWWTTRRKEQLRDVELSGYEWTYLRLKNDGMPVAGGFEAWPGTAREIRLLDPCMGSGHFLAAALPILAYMRMEEEGLSLDQAIKAALTENIFGLELDARCSQIAAFNLAVTAWRLAKQYFAIPQLNLACSGLGVNSSEADWIRVAGADPRAQQTMRKLHSAFRQAPILGSLVDPTRFGQELFADDFSIVIPLLQSALGAEQGGYDSKERVLAAQGLLAAAHILSEKFTLISTNVPYLGRNRQVPALAKHCDDYYPDAKADIATCFLERCLRLCSEGGSLAIVTKNEPLFAPNYKDFRRHLLRTATWKIVANLGPRAFETITGERVSVALIVLDRTDPRDDQEYWALNVGPYRTPAEKTSAIKIDAGVAIGQMSAIGNPDSVVSTEPINRGRHLSEYAYTAQGFATSDNPPFVRFFWEFPGIDNGWVSAQSAPLVSLPYEGRSDLLLWEDGKGKYYEHARRLKEAGRLGGWKSGGEAWGKQGVLVAEMRGLPCTLYSGGMFDHTAHAIIPRDTRDLPAIWAFCSSPEFKDSVRRISQKLNVTNETLVKIPFLRDYWQLKAGEQYPDGLPYPQSSDPTQWLFSGNIRESSHPLHVAVARLLGYSWPRQTGSDFPDCPAIAPDDIERLADSDGIVCLSSIAGESSAAQRLREILAAAYQEEWSAGMLSELLSDCDSLEIWLRDHFFQEHCQLFQQIPFVWHIWDGMKDGFHALVNYHKLAAPNGEGRKTLEKLVYTSLGDWITRQRAELASGVEGADTRLTAAVHLKAELEKILLGEKPYDIFVRWKPLHEQPIAWQPVIDDGVRPNIRPFLAATLAPSIKPNKGSCVLRISPKIPYGKDRGKEPLRPKEDFPWFWSWDEQTENFEGSHAFDGGRWNDLHYSLDAKTKARERKSGRAGK